MKKHIGIPGERGEVGQTLCGRHAALIVSDSHADCVKCLRLYSARQDTIRPVSWSEAIREILTTIQGPAVEPYPRLTPTLWRAMRCRMGTDYCTCELCTLDKANEKALDLWKEREQKRIHNRHQFTFGSVNAALEALLRWQNDGPSARSPHGNLVTRAQETVKLGTAVQTTQRVRDDLTIRRATHAADIELAARRAYADPAVRQGLSVDLCVYLLISSVDSTAPTITELGERYGLSETAIKRLIVRGRRSLTIELAAAEYIPIPRDRSGKLTQAIEARRVKL